MGGRQEGDGGPSAARSPGPASTSGSGAAAGGAPRASSSALLLSMDDFNDFRQIGKGK
jgi:hypothetical protein